MFPQTLATTNPFLLTDGKDPATTTQFPPSQDESAQDTHENQETTENLTRLLDCALDTQTSSCSQKQPQGKLQWQHREN